MRDDLLEAQACIDWAVSNLPSFQQRLDAWMKENVYLVINELPPDTPNNVLVAQEKEALPLVFNAEAGAYINAIRSSLDILATALVHRYGIPIRDDEAYFPIASSKAAFLDGKYKGVKFVQGLPQPERSIIESLKPYKGGDDLLYALHHLDIARKHRRLLAVEPNPGSFRIQGWGMDKFYTPTASGWLCGPGETILGLVAKGAPQMKMEFVGYIGLNEPGATARHPLVPTLGNFASLANSIIKLFDGP